MSVLTDLENAEKALEAVWATLPLTAGQALFVVEKAPLFGAYEARPNSAFKVGETLLTYIEPVGYSWKQADDGFVDFGVSLDFEILEPDGKVLGGQRGFLSYSARSRAKVRELMLNASLNLTGCAAGDYVLQYTLRDLFSTKMVEIPLSFSIVD